MRNTEKENRVFGRILASAAALAAAFMLAVMPAAAATITATDVMIRNSGEVKDNNIIGVLNKGDKVEVLSKSTDSSGIEWFFVKLPNGNTGYVKSEWVDNGGKEVKTVQPPVQEETPVEEKETKKEEKKETEKKTEKKDQPEEDEEVLDDWTREDTETEKKESASDNEKASASTVADDQEKPASDDSAYDPYKDPNAQFSINFVADEDGSGNWYLYNYNSDKQFRLVDLEKLGSKEAEAQKYAASAVFWRTIACILLILAALAVILYFVLSGRIGGDDGRRPGRGRRKRGSGSEEAEDPFDYDAAPAKEPSRRRTRTDRKTDSVSAQEPSDEQSERKGFSGRLGALFNTGAAEENEIDSDTLDDSSSVGEEDEEETVDRGSSVGDTFVDQPLDRDSYEDSSIDGDAFEEEPVDGMDDDGYVRQKESAAASARRFPEEDQNEEDLVDEEPVDDDAYDEDEDYDDDYEPKGRGIFGFLKNLFSSEDDDDADYDDEDDYAEEDEEEDYTREYEEEKPAPVNRGRKAPQESSRRRQRRQRSYNFDEETDYPEDADLIPAPPLTSPDAAEGEDAEAASEQSPAPAPASYAGASSAGASAFRAAPPLDDSGDDDFYLDEDDDMDYPFLSGRPKR